MYNECTGPYYQEVKSTHKIPINEPSAIQSVPHNVEISVPPVPRDKNKISSVVENMLETEGEAQSHSKDEKPLSES